jgi:hypothetical protein
LSCSIFKFLRNPRKPVILAMSRPDAKKNITTLVKAFGKNKVLREIANLVLILGNREVRTNSTVLRYDIAAVCCALRCSAGLEQLGLSALL